MNITILDDYQDCVRHLNCYPTLAQHDVQIFNDNVKDINSLASRLASAHAIVLMRQRTVVDKELLDRLPNLRMISQTGTTGGHLDMAACTEHGVAVMEGEGEGSTTAELTWALILASRRYLVDEVNRLHGGFWQGFLGQQLSGQQLGIYGYGRIGRQVAGYGKAFGMKVWVLGREGSAARARADGVEVAPAREAFFAESDVVSLHIRLNAKTRGLITSSDLARMKKTALIVNTSRAELVQENALAQALRLGAPGFAAVDVYEQEPILGAAYPLLELPNALCTPHIGFVEHDSYETYYATAFDNILRFANGDMTPVLNSDALTHAH